MRRLGLRVYWILALGLLWGAAVEAASSNYPIFRSLMVSETTFDIRVNDLPAAIPVQGITLRAVYHPPAEATLDFGSDRSQRVKSGAAGYRAYHLEFLYRDRKIDYTELTRVDFRKGVEVIYTISIDESTSRMSNGNEPVGEVRAFAINLENVPLAILDEVDIINIREPK